MKAELVGLNRLKYNDDSTWPITIDGYYLSAITKYLRSSGEIPSDGIQDIVDNASAILSRCVNPIINTAQNSTGLVIGRVQSGKTSNFITLAALAFDNGFNLVIVLGGTKNNLVSQNSLRIENAFIEIADEVFVLNATKNKSQLTEESIVQFLETGKKIVIVLLKHPKHINLLKNSLFNTPTFNQESILIIDDEGDEASLNTLVKKGKESAIYKSIKGLRGQILKHTYISVTATPQANILIEAIDVLSPEFGILIDPGEGYCGLDVFHGQDDSYCISISDDEPSLVDGLIPVSFLSALSLFVVGAALRTFWNSGRSVKSSMLIHPSYRIDDLNKVGKLVEGLLVKWRTLANNINDIASNKLFLLLDEAYSNLTNQPGLSIRNSGIENIVLNVIKTSRSYVVHGENLDSDTDKFSSYNIYLGGNLLSRGLTLKGLITTYIIRTAKGKSNVDTVEQRARWFGYKRDYLDVCRILATPKILRHYMLIRDHENDLWETVKRGNLQGMKFKELPRIFLLSDELDMTRSNVARAQKFNFNFWNFQRAYQDNQAYIDSNNNILWSYKNRYHDEITTLRFSEVGRPHEVLTNRDFVEVNNEILQKFIFPPESDLNSIMINKLQDVMLRKGIVPKIDIYWMRVGQPAVHPVREGIVSEYMVGRSPLDLTKPQVYPGDRNLVKDDVMQLQVHLIKKKDTEIISPTLALYIPEKYVSDITGLVVRA